MRSPRAVLPTWAAQLGWGEEDRTALGRWAPNSEMPNWYGRAVCNTELRLRNDIATKVSEGWKPTGAFELPTKRPTPAPEEEESSADSTSVVTSSEEEVNIADLDDTDSAVSGYAASV